MHKFFIISMSHNFFTARFTCSTRPLDETFFPWSHIPRSSAQ